MTREEREKHLDWLYRLKSNIFVFMPIDWIIPFADALDVAIKALEQEPTTKNDLAVDAVSRQAINGYIDYILSHGMGKKKSFDFIKKFVAKLPSVTPQEPILDQITEIIEPLRHLPIGEMSDIEWDILRVIDKYKGESEG